MRLRVFFTAAFSALATVFAFAALLTPVTAGIDGSIAESAYLSVKLVNQNPDPVSPGELLELRFRIENQGTAPARDVSLELVPSFPYSVGSTERIKSLGTLSGLQNGKDAATARFLITVDDNAGSGVAPINVRLRTATHGWTTLDNFNITIKQRELPVSITSVVAQPGQLIQGDQATIKLGLTNFGSSAVMNLKVKLNYTDSFLPSAPSESFIPTIAPKGNASAELALLASPVAKSGMYALSAIMTYSDSSGKNYTLAQPFSVAVGSTGQQLSASILSSDLLKLGVKRHVTIEIFNNGLADLKFVTAALAKSGAYEILSPDSTYLGDLESGNSDTASYDVFFREPGPLLLDVQYTDQFNSQRQQRIEVMARIYSSREIGAFGMEKNNAKGILITIIIIAVGVFAYKMLRRRRKKQGG